MRDFESFQDALLERRQTHGDEDGPAYQDSLMNSMSLVLDEFYKHLRVRPCSRSLSPGLRSRRRAGAVEPRRLLDPARTLPSPSTSHPSLFLSHLTDSLPPSLSSSARRPSASRP